MISYRTHAERLFLLPLTLRYKSLWWSRTTGQYVHSKKQNAVCTPRTRNRVKSIAWFALCIRLLFVKGTNDSTLPDWQPRRKPCSWSSQPYFCCQLVVSKSVSGSPTSPHISDSLEECTQLLSSIDIACLSPLISAYIWHFLRLCLWPSPILFFLHAAQACTLSQEKRQAWS